MKKNSKGASFYLIIALVLMSILTIFSVQNAPKKVLYSDVYNYFNTEQVTTFAINGNRLIAKLIDGTEITYDLSSEFIFQNNLGDKIIEQYNAGIITNYDYRVQQSSWLGFLLPYIILFGLLLMFWFFASKKSGSGRAGGMGFGKSRAKMLTDEQKTVTFKDVAGADEEKAELEEIVEFLKDSQKFTNVGARIPKGLLLVGPPGTGKTLLARSVAGEAGTPFFTISGSDFVELYVGVGASRVRDLFEQAKKNAPSIIFIDEIDAVGRRRGAGVGGGNDEREQTLNQLLVEMDGFAANAGVIIIAATNRSDVLDPALLRPGRFDRQVYVGYPDIKGRTDILKVHSRNKPLEESVDLEDIAKGTSGFTGADLENLLNESALLAAKNNREKICSEDIEASFLKVVVGTEKKNRKTNEYERKLTAYHEAGHAIVSRLLPSQDPVHRVSIIPRGGAGGFTLNRPQEDKSYTSKTHMQDSIVVFLGGRVAEKLVMNDISSGASSDIMQLTKIATNMVIKYGMSDKIGPINYVQSEEQMFLGGMNSQPQISEAVNSSIDLEIKSIIQNAYETCENLIKNNMDKLEHIAEYLLRNEVIDAADFEKLFNGENLPDVIKPEIIKIDSTKKDDVAENETKKDDAKQDDSKMNDIKKDAKPQDGKTQDTSKQKVINKKQNTKSIENNKEKIQDNVEDTTLDK